MGDGHIAAVSAVAFSRRGPKFAVSGGADKLLKVGNPLVSHELLRLLQVQRLARRCLSRRQPSRQPQGAPCTALIDGIGCWQHRCLFCHLRQHVHNPPCAACQVWDLPGALVEADAAGTGAGAPPVPMHVTAAVAAHDKDINAVAVSPNDALVVTASQDRTAKVWPPGW